MKKADCVSAKGRDLSVSGRTCQSAEIALRDYGGCLLFSSWIALLPAAYKIRNRWIKVAFQTPSSNSWRRSTTNIDVKLNRPLNRFINVF